MFEFNSVFYSRADLGDMSNQIQILNCPSFLWKNYLFHLLFQLVSSLFILSPLSLSVLFS